MTRCTDFFLPFPNPRHPPRASHCPLLQYVTCRLAQLTHIPPGALTSFDVCMMLVMVTVLCKSTIYYMMTMTKLYFTERQGTIQMNKGTKEAVEKFLYMCPFLILFHFFPALKIVSLIFDILQRFGYCVLRFCAYLVPRCILTFTPFEIVGVRRIV